MFNSKRINKLEYKIFELEEKLTILESRLSVKVVNGGVAAASDIMHTAKHQNIDSRLTKLEGETRIKSFLYERDTKLIPMLFGIAVPINLPRTFPVNNVVDLILKHLKLEVDEVPETPVVPASLILKPTLPLKPVSSKRKKTK